MNFKIQYTLYVPIEDLDVEAIHSGHDEAISTGLALQLWTTTNLDKVDETTSFRH